MLTSTKLEQVTETQREFDPKAWFKNPDFQMLCAKKIEGQFYERKSTRDPERLAATICAFANSKPQGGLLAVGISDDGEIDGLLHRADVNLNEIANYRPFTGTQSHSKFVDCTNKHGKRDQILLIYVPYLENRVAETSKGKAYIRQGDKTIELRDSERRELEYSKGQKSFEDEKACVFSRDILSDDIIAEFRQGVARKDGASTDVLLEQVLQSKGLLKKDGDMLHLTKAAILFLGKDPCVHFPGAYIRFLRYSGTEKKTGQEQNLIKDEFFKEPLPRLIIRIKDFLKTQLRDFTYLGPDGKFVTEPEYPEPALLEAIVNAVVHRSYSQMNMCIHIEMYDDRIEIQSPGDYPPGVHPREFVHHARNHRLMDGMRLYCPERGYSRADYKAPYYQVKHFLLEAGFPSQMVDEETIANPSWKDYNLALDMFAKTGHVPWVLSEGLPNADLFLGLSYSSISGVGPSSRLMGYVNVFDRYGKWLFYRGNTEQIRFSDRNRAFRGLLESVAKEYAQRAKLQRVHVHHKFKLSQQARTEIAAGVKIVAPHAEVSFVYVNEHSMVRLYDNRPDGDGSLRRGSYVLTAPNRFFLATTGQNEFNQKGMGTPRPLDVSVNRIGANGELDMKFYAQQLLSLTRLNWASTKDFCREPITLKFASDIAHLMNVFLASFGSFKLHPRLEKTPWFL